MGPFCDSSVIYYSFHRLLKEGRHVALVESRIRWIDGLVFGDYLAKISQCFTKTSRLDLSNLHNGIYRQFCVAILNDSAGSMSRTAQIGS